MNLNCFCGGGVCARVLTFTDLHVDMGRGSEQQPTVLGMDVKIHLCDACLSCLWCSSTHADVVADQRA